MPVCEQSVTNGLFFIVGAPRSGTTLLQAILSSHPRIMLPSETEFFMKFIPSDRATSDEALWEAYIEDLVQSERFQDQGLDTTVFTERMKHTGRNARNVFLTMMMMHAEKTGCPRIGEKSPHHCRHVETILSHFPHAKFIHIHRDPRDVAASLQNTPWSRGSHRNHAKEWAKIMCEHDRLLKLLPGSCYTEIAYKRLVTNTESEIRRLCDFLGEVYDPDMLQFHERSDDGYSPREQEWKSRTRRPISNDRIDVYKKMLTPRQIASIERITAAWLCHFGYTTSHMSNLQRLESQSVDVFGGICDSICKVRNSILKRLGG